MADETVYSIKKSTLDNIADAINAKASTTGKLTPTAMPTAISNISTGIDTSDATAMSADIIAGKTAYVKGVKITGSIVVYDGTVV